MNAWYKDSFSRANNFRCETELVQGSYLCAAITRSQGTLTYSETTLLILNVNFFVKNIFDEEM
jgi:hypothetical protein